MDHKTSRIFRALSEKTPDVLLSLRKQAKLTQLELASLAGISESAVYAHEHGINRPYKIVLRQYSEIFAKAIKNPILEA